MTKAENRREVVRYWMEKALESLDSAQDELAARRMSFSVNRLYYACFYVVSALLLARGHQFRKHSGVRAAFHRHFVKPGLVNTANGRLYDELFEARQRGDYVGLVRFEMEQVRDWLARAQGFVEAVSELIGAKSK